VSIRLVMNPDKMVIDEARRTFTYLNLYGYLTDAVVVNRVFPAEVGAYFDEWRSRQQEHLADVRAAFGPVPVLCAPYFASEVVGPEMLGRLGRELFGELDPGAMLHAGLAQQLEVHEHGATLRLDLPFAQRGDVSLKKVGPELIVRVDGHKRTIMLPPALERCRPSEARLADGTLAITFVETGEHAAAAAAGGARRG
jgi:arsenite-transporting ATPase